MEKIRQQIQESGLPMTRWAKAHGISIACISRYMSGKNMSLQSFLALSRASGIPVGELIAERVQTIS